MPSQPADIRAALAQLVAAAADGRLDALSARLGVRVLGVFGSACREPSEAHDLDIAVSFLGDAEVLALIDGLTEFTGCDAIDIMELDVAGPVARAEGLVGIPLFEHEPGAYATAQMAALAEKRDTDWLRRLDLDALAG
jgi:predicted nucleotidyltransferase